MTGEKKSKKGTAGAIAPDTPLAELKGVGARTAELFASGGWNTAGELLRHYPRSYDFFEDPKPLSECVTGQLCAVKLTIRQGGSSFHAGGRSVCYFRAGDGEEEIRLSYFNQPYLRRTLSAGMIRIFRGILKQSRNGNRYMEQPQIYRPEDYVALSGSMQPRYGLVQGLKNGQIMRAVSRILERIGEEGWEADYLSEEERTRLALMEETEALRAIHFPVAAAEAAAAHRRLAFDEFFFFLLAVYGARGQREELANRRPMLETAEPERLIERLPYALTAGQRQAWREIRDDLCGGHVMNRLLQGDVGSGKTILAFLALLLTASNGRQGALMVPTEVLARQHMRGMEAMAEAYGIPFHPVLLTGSVKGTARRRAYEDIASGAAGVIVGTHALIQEKLVYRDLGLVVTDEQHRFGVRQRENLAGKGEEVPILVMSATPIPRTLALILYGDLRVSVLREKPDGRLPVKNSVVDERWRGKAYRFIAAQVREGRQAYVICPAIEAGELDHVANVEDYAPALREALPEEISVGSLHGKMKPLEKERIMEDFAEQRIDVLVSTTVVEVGVNVPNATVMLVENAERFGLSQLHQLRGRVGRGAEQSYCIFLYSGTGEKPKRLEILEHSTDGFYIAEEDLRLRGPGDVFGIRQSGELGFESADIYADQDVLRQAAELAEAVLGADPELKEEKNTGIRRRLLRDRAKSIDFRSI
ncbi:ATP-dependent DNA helicase RecG [Lachnoclostridium sp. Marseille-P6806]|uniref:ATP-dependent DNA helicase RecG n=1 Tax=Lachnoclostridium sp. Marseille-P6806 TaxID=2364793 RepID=UPI0010301FEB|nr:ATP-dependent DNA helicase RecG [Lachnoclostridium sp. Marseille-P6806]